MARFVYIVLTVAVASVYCAEARSRRCSSPNEVWNKCGSDCEARCFEPEGGLICPAVCVEKCSCKPGYIRGPDGDCITTRDCAARKKCLDRNQIWNECGSDCETRCIEPKDGLFCPAVCVPKCSCKAGYVIGPDGDCITTRDCAARKKCLDRNQIWNECGSDCEARCNEPKDQQVCTDVCVPKCSCKPGYVIGSNGTCIKKEECKAH